MFNNILAGFLKKIQDAANTVPELFSELKNLTELSALYGAEDKLSDEELASLKQNASALKKAAETLILNPDAVDEGFAEYIPALKSITAPLECFCKNLDKNPDSIKDALCDTSWLDGYIGEPVPVEENGSILQGSCNTDGLNFAEIIGIYKNETEKAGNAFTEHLKNLSLDGDDPLKVLKAKLDVIETVVMYFENGQFGSDFALAAKDAYERAWRSLNLKSIDTLAVSGEQHLSDAIYGVTADSLYDFTVFSGDMEAMKNVDPETRRRLLDIAGKLRLKRENLGVTAEQADLLNKTGATAAMFENCYSSVVMNRPDAANDPKNMLYPVLGSLKECSDRVLSLLRGEAGAKAPSSGELRRLVSQIKEYVTKQELLDADGSVRHDVIYLDSFTGKLAECCPELGEDYEEIRKKVREKGVEAYILINKRMAKARREEEIKLFCRALHSIRSCGLVSRKIIEESKFFSMAANPVFCSMEVQNATEALVFLVKHNTAAGNSGFDRLLTVFDALDMLADDDAVYGEIYKTILLGYIFGRNGEENPVVSDGDYLDFYGGFGSSEAAKRLLSMSPAEFLQTVQDKTALKNAVSALTTHEFDFLEKTDKSTLDALTQESGNPGAANSDEYNAIKESVFLIKKKDRGITGGSLEDYRGLVMNCAKYLNIRSSSSLTPNGRKRFDAAAKILRTAGPGIAPKLTNEDRMQLEKDLTVTMFRSKKFREAFIAETKERIFNVFGGAENISENSFRELKQSDRDFIAFEIRMLDTAQNVSEVLKNAGAEEILTEKIKSAEDFAKINSFAEKLLSRKEITEQFRENPCAVIKKLTAGFQPGIQAPAAKL